MFKLLLSQFIKQNGRNPNNLEMILLKQKAANQSVDERKVVSMFDRSAVNPNKPILGGKNIQETEDEIRRRLMKQNEEGIASMKSKLEDPEKKAKGGRIGLKGGADAATESFSKSAGSTRPGRKDPVGGFNLSGGQGPTFGGAPPTTGGGGGGPPRIINSPPKDNKPPITTTSDDSVNRGFLSDSRKKNQAKYNRLINTYKPDDFDVMNQIDGTSNLSEEDAKFMERYGAGKKYRDLSKTNIENFFEIDPKGVPPKKDPTSYSGDYKYNFVDANDIPKFNFEEMTGITSQDPANMQLAKVFNTKEDLIGLGAAKDSFFDTLTPQGKALEKFRNSAVNFKKAEQNTANTPQAALDFMQNKPGSFSDVLDNQEFIQNAIDKGFLEDESDYANQLPLKKAFADGGRAGYKFGTGKKGVEGLLDLIRNKFGKKSITTADKAPIPPKTLERNMFKKADENFKNKRMLDDDEYQDFLDEVGGADQLEAYDFDGTVGDAKRIIKEQKRYMDDMELEYKKGDLDPEPGDKSPARKRFLEKKLEEMEASGDKRLMTVDEIEELSSFDLGSEMDVVKTLAPKMVERLQLKQKYPGITDDLLDKILIDDNVQRKAEVLATIDEAFKMMEKGKGTDEILDTMKNVTRTKQADGGITRIGLKAGSVDKMRRLILKAIGAGTAGIGAAKSGMFSFGKGAGKEVAKEVVQKSTNTPPPYFFKLAEKIKMMGDDATATTDRTIAKTLKSKDGKSTYVLEEDVSTGDTIIKKINKEGDEMMTDVEIMELKKGEVVMGKDGKPVKVPDEYEEVTEVNARIEGDTFNDPYYSDGIKIDEIIKEVDDKVPSIKYASGGLAYMLGE